MTKYHEAGKGGDMRPTDHKKFSSGYDLIWGNKNIEKVTCERCGKDIFVNKLDEYSGIHTCTPKENQSA